MQDAGKPFPLRTNIYLPRGAAAAPTPLVLFIHGNGGAYNFSNGSRAYEFSIALAERGLAVATIDYRPDDALPGEIHDVKGYVRWFRAKAKDYNIDPDRIGVWGTSRGGHLGALLATSGDVKELEGDVGGNLEHSSRIQCAVLYYSVTEVLGNGADLAAQVPDRARAQDAPGGLAAQLLGIKDPRGLAPAREAAAKNATSDPSWKAVELSRLSDPVRYVTKGAAPILLAHSSIDSVVAVEQSERLYRKISRERPRREPLPLVTGRARRRRPRHRGGVLRVAGEKAAGRAGAEEVAARRATRYRGPTLMGAGSASGSLATSRAAACMATM